MLVDNREIVEQYTGIGFSLNFEKIKPHVNSVERQHLTPLLGASLYAQLLAFKANPGGVEPGSKIPDLLPFAQTIIVSLGVAVALDFLQVQISDLGVLRTEKTDEKSAYHYQKLEAQEAYYRKGYREEDLMLSYLEANRASFPDWQESEGYTIAREYFIANASQFSKFYSINNSRRTFLALMHIMGRVEEFTISEVVGEALFDLLKTQIKENTLSPENTTLLDRFIRPATANFTIQAANEELALEVTHKGVILSQVITANMNVEEKKAPPSNRIEVVAGKAQATGQLYLSKLRDYLIKTASDTVYPAFYNSDLYPKSTNTADPREDLQPRRRRIYRGL